MRRPDILKQKLIEGLEQAEVDCYLPQVTVHKSFNQFIKYDIFCHGLINPPSDPSSPSSQTDVKHLKFVTQPLYPTMIKQDHVTSVIHKLPPSQRFSTIFRQYYHQDTLSSNSHSHNNNNQHDLHKDFSQQNDNNNISQGNFYIHV